MQKTLIRLLLTLVAVSLGLLALVFVLNLYLIYTSPTPAEFVRSQGITYSPETQKTLADFNEVVTIEKGSFAEDIYRAINRPTGDTQIYAYHVTPSGINRLLGAGPIIVLPILEVGSASLMILDQYNKSTSLARNMDAINFSYTLFHELGHEAIRLELGKDARRLDPLFIELYCDRYAVDLLRREYGDIGRAYVLASRAINPFSAERDVILALMREEAPSVEAELRLLAAEQATFEPFRKLVKQCVKYQAATLDSNADGVDRVYACLKNRYSGKNPIASENPYLQKRASAFISGYELIFLGKDSAYH